jgi:hypothetical protein
MTDLTLRPRPGAVTKRLPVVLTPEYREKIAWRERAAAEPFHGVATEAGIEPNLFPLRDTGIDMTLATRAAQSYLARLNEPELQQGHLPMHDRTWRHWSNGARFFLRHGLCLEDLEVQPRELALEVVRSSVSEGGFTQVIDLMHLNRTIGEIRDEVEMLNEWVYWFTIYGEPEPGRPWGWQLDGHHVNVNCVFVGDQMVLTPTFLGAEPVFASAGRYAGTRAFRPEEAGGVDLFRSLNGRQQSVSRIAEEMPPDLFVGAFRDNFELNYEGIRLDQLTPKQHAIALELIGLYVDRAPVAHARVRMQEVLEHDTETHFAWIGDAGPDGVFYYRIHSPVILVEFEHQAGVMFDNDHPTRNHVHTVVRTPNGNDYGVDLLRQHHELHHHH